MTQILDNHGKMHRCDKVHKVSTATITYLAVKTEDKRNYLLRTFEPEELISNYSNRVFFEGRSRLKDPCYLLLHENIGFEESVGLAEHYGKILNQAQSERQIPRQIL